MNRRGFLQAILAAGVAPAIVRASSLMTVKAPIQVATLEETLAFGVASIKAEGTALCYDHAKMLWPAVKRWFDEEYLERPISVAELHYNDK